MCAEGKTNKRAWICLINREKTKYKTSKYLFDDCLTYKDIMQLQKYNTKKKVKIGGKYEENIEASDEDYSVEPGKS